MCLSCHFLYIGIADCLASSISAISRTRTSSSISKDDTEMREVLNNQDNVTTFDCHWKGMESWGGNNKSFVAVTMRQLKEVSNVHRAWYSPSKLHTIVRGRVFLLTILQTPPNREGITYPPSGDALNSPMGEAMETVTNKLDHIMLYRAHLAWAEFEPNVSGNRYCCKSIIRSRLRRPRYPLVTTTIHFLFFEIYIRGL